MNLKFGDIISFEFSDDSCWGRKGVYTGIVMYSCNEKKHYIHYLDQKLITQRLSNGGACPEYDVLEDFIDSTYATNIQLIGNIARNV